MAAHQQEDDLLALTSSNNLTRLAVILSNAVTSLQAPERQKLLILTSTAVHLAPPPGNLSKARAQHR